jgi:hypothetical protein
VEVTEGTTVHGTENDALWEDSDKELSYDDLGHPGPSDSWWKILADKKIKCCLMFSEIKCINLLLNV